MGKNSLILLVGAILGLIGMFCPVTYDSISGVTIMTFGFGLAIMTGGGMTDTAFASDIEFTMFLLLALLGAILMIIGVVMAKKEKDKPGGAIGIVGGLLVLLAPIILLVSPNTSMLFEIFTMSVGIFLPIIAGIIGMIGGGLMVAGIME